MFVNHDVLETGNKEEEGDEGIKYAGRRIVKKNYNIA